MTMGVQPTKIHSSKTTELKRLRRELLRRIMLNESRRRIARSNAAK